MEQNIKDDDFFESGVNEEIPLRNTNNVRAKANKCNQCKYESSSNSTLKRHLISHSGEKPNKCDQCNYVLRMLSSKHFEDTFENTQRRKAKQMQAMLICLLRSKCFKDTF